MGRGRPVTCSQKASVTKTWVIYTMFNYLLNSQFFLYNGWAPIKQSRGLPIWLGFRGRRCKVNAVRNLRHSGVKLTRDIKNWGSPEPRGGKEMKRSLPVKPRGAGERAPHAEAGGPQTDRGLCVSASVMGASKAKHSWPVVAGSPKSEKC